MEFYFNKSFLRWAIKDSSSRYVYINERMGDYFNMAAEQIKGCSDADIISDIGDFHKYILDDDHKIITTNKMSMVLKVFSYGKNETRKASLVEKRPWYFPDGSAGIICTYLELTNVWCSTFLSLYCRRPLVFTKPSDFFTDREWEVILLLLCGEKQSLIAGILGISRFTLRNRIIRCCQKAGVVNVSRLLEYCHCRGWDNYIPPFFLSRRHLIIG